MGRARGGARGQTKRATTKANVRGPTEQVGYRFSMFKAQAARRGKRVELLRHEFAGMLRRPCVYCGSTERIGIDRVQNDGHYTHANSVTMMVVLRAVQSHEGHRAAAGVRGTHAAPRPSAGGALAYAVGAVKGKWDFLFRWLRGVVVSRGGY